MNTKTKKKLCWNCEGNVGLNDETCPYCGVSLEVSPMISAAYANETLNPPYSSTKNTNDSPIPQAPYSPQAEQPIPETAEVPVAHKVTNELQKTAIAISALLLGFTLLLFSLILILFSDDNGYLTLRWSAHYWYLYLIIGTPLLYWGWTTASTLEEME